MLDIIFQQFGPLFPSGEDAANNWWVTLLWILPIFFFMAYGQRIQMWMVMNDVGKSLNKLKEMREKSKNDTVNYINSIHPSQDHVKNIEYLMEYFTIMPVDLDPNGIVRKIQHIIRVRDDKVKAEIRKLIPNADDITASKVENILEAITMLNTIYKIVRHFYLLGKKTTSMFFVIQLQMVMPMLLEQAEALQKAIDAFKQGQPIGDGIGPMIAGQFMLDKEKKIVAKETVVANGPYNGRQVYFMKAQGPGGTVGDPGTAVERLVSEMGIKPKFIIMIDAALKLEGEETGEVAEGVGAAIGGIGVEKYQIEEVATKYGIPIHAIIIKQSVLDAITVMKREIAESVEKVNNAIFRLINEKSNEGDTILVIGVGNTLGVAQ
ncbi:MAG: DUF1512 domain-containing protein [Candidatus Nitrosothermus koennekii]|nr:MAG: DUF1512 domain-containing protein [Candidatus Nitrosothermus koennekii]